jgi:hypothetical protein
MAALDWQPFLSTTKLKPLSIHSSAAQPISPSSFLKAVVSLRILLSWFYVFVNLGDGFCLRTFSFVVIVTDSPGMLFLTLLTKCCTHYSLHAPLYREAKPTLLRRSAVAVDWCKSAADDFSRVCLVSGSARMPLSHWNSPCTRCIIELPNDRRSPFSSRHGNGPPPPSCAR